jgi:hypothetical protein
MFYFEDGSRWSDCDGSVLSQFDLEPDASIVGNDDGGSSEGGVVGSHWGLYSPCDVLAFNIVLGSAREFSGDAIFILQVDGEGASEGS